MRPEKKSPAQSLQLTIRDQPALTPSGPRAHKALSESYSNTTGSPEDREITALNSKLVSLSTDLCLPLASRPGGGW